MGAPGGRVTAVVSLACLEAWCPDRWSKSLAVFCGSIGMDSNKGQNTKFQNKNTQVHYRLSIHKTSNNN